MNRRLLHGVLKQRRRAGIRQATHGRHAQLYGIVRRFGGCLARPWVDGADRFAAPSLCRRRRRAKRLLTPRHRRWGHVRLLGFGFLSRHNTTEQGKGRHSRPCEPNTRARGAAASSRGLLLINPAEANEHTFFAAAENDEYVRMDGLHAGSTGFIRRTLVFHHAHTPKAIEGALSFHRCAPCDMCDTCRQAKDTHFLRSSGGSTTVRSFSIARSVGVGDFGGSTTALRRPSRCSRNRAFCRFSSMSSNMTWRDMCSATRFPCACTGGT